MAGPSNYSEGVSTNTNYKDMLDVLNAASQNPLAKVAEVGSTLLGTYQNKLDGETDLKLNRRLQLAQDTGNLPELDLLTREGESQFIDKTKGAAFFDKLKTAKEATNISLLTNAANNAIRNNDLSGYEKILANANTSLGLAANNNFQTTFGAKLPDLAINSLTNSAINTLDNTAASQLKTNQDAFSKYGAETAELFKAAGSDPNKQAAVLSQRGLPDNLEVINGQLVTKDLAPLAGEDALAKTNRQLSAEQAAKAFTERVIGSGYKTSTVNPDEAARNLETDLRNRGIPADKVNTAVTNFKLGTKTQLELGDKGKEQLALAIAPIDAEAARSKARLDEAYSTVTQKLGNAKVEAISKRISFTPQDLDKTISTLATDSAWFAKGENQGSFREYLNKDVYSKPIDLGKEFGGKQIPTPYQLNEAILRAKTETWYKDGSRIDIDNFNDVLTQVMKEADPMKGEAADVITAITNRHKDLQDIDTRATQAKLQAQQRVYANNGKLIDQTSLLSNFDKSIADAKSKLTTEQRTEINRSNLSGKANVTDLSANKAKITEIMQKLGATSEDMEIVSNLASRESSFRPNKINPRTGASGYYQILGSTWDDIEKRLWPKNEPKPDRNDPVDQTKAILLYTKSNLAQLDPKVYESKGLNRKEAAYGAHFIGAGGLNETLKATNPNTPMVDIVGKLAVEKNPEALKNATAGSFLKYLKGGLPNTNLTGVTKDKLRAQAAEQKAARELYEVGEKAKQESVKTTSIADAVPLVNKALSKYSGSAPVSSREMSELVSQLEPYKDNPAVQAFKTRVSKLQGATVTNPRIEKTIPAYELIYAKKLLMRDIQKN